jgi:putative transposase
MVRPRQKGLSVRRQCELLTIHRNRLYYQPVGEKPENIKMMSLMDKHMMNHPTEGVMSIVLFLLARGYPVGPKRIRRLLRLMGRETLYRRKNLTRLGLKQFIKPYLLRGLTIDRPNQVWCTDITYIPMKKGFMYLTAIIDVYSRKIVGWGLSNTRQRNGVKRSCKRLLPPLGNQRLSTPIRAPNTPARCGPSTWKNRKSRSPWTARVGRQIISGSSGSGSRSNTTTYT